MLNEMRRDLDAALHRDPAARSRIEVALLYPGVHAVWGYRLAHRLWERGHRFGARWLSYWLRRRTGVEIHPAARIGAGLFIDHATGVVIGETAEVGEDVTLYHGVTLGGRSLEHGKRHPTLGDRVVVGAGAKILGPVEIGHDTHVGANAVVLESMPSHAVVVGAPARVVRRDPRLCSTIEGTTPEGTITVLPGLAEQSESVIDFSI
ncbi:serine O-acetyltransferase [Acidimicrobium ferrooxidans DSM 10331]|uniref:Serine acetyltransferase n=1 Tax=Acidimicrobium ferrooxidans (strain DSM 10331 / JCM 15462 / NBRC 103882 / ICP) TaxID=525909 RepID=C7LZV3_ACIFD|nr:serine O-acetyltransferase [Acidimicrobium ferrooxidans]ACU54261.1 serine O-acetyltransferase [Acidimicrobium ferrooxidans DSM 10331]